MAARFKLRTYTFPTFYAGHWTTGDPLFIDKTFSWNITNDTTYLIWHRQVNLVHSKPGDQGLIVDG